MLVQAQDGAVRQDGRGPARAEARLGRARRAAGGDRAGLREHCAGAVACMLRRRLEFFFFFFLLGCRDHAIRDYPVNRNFCFAF